MFTRWAQRTFKSLEHRDYRVLWTGTSIAFLAFMMSAVAQSVVAFDLTGKNGSVGFVSLGMGVATIVMSPFGGVIADRFAKRRLLFIGQTLIGLNFAVVGLLIVTDQLTLLMLATSTLILGTVFSFIGPARQAWIGELVPAQDLPNAIALQQVGMTATRIFGPFMAAGLVGTPFVGTGGTYLFMAAMFGFVIFTLWQLPASKPVAATRRSVMGDMMLGVDHIRERPRLALLCISFVCVVMTGFSYLVILPGYLENVMGRDSADMAFLLAISAVTGFGVTVGLANAADTQYAWRWMLGGGLLLGVSLVLLGFAPGFVSALGAMLLVGAGAGAFQLINNALIMQEAEPAFHGRVMSVTMLAWGVNGLVAYPLGAMADQIGERETLALAGAGVVAVTLATWAAYASITRREDRGRVRVATVVGGE